MERRSQLAGIILEHLSCTAIDSRAADGYDGMLNLILVSCCPFVPQQQNRIANLQHVPEYQH